MIRDKSLPRLCHFPLDSGLNSTAAFWVNSISFYLNFPDKDIYGILDIWQHLWNCDTWQQSLPRRWRAHLLSESHWQSHWKYFTVRKYYQLNNFHACAKFCLGSHFSPWLWLFLVWTILIYALSEVEFHRSYKLAWPCLWWIKNAIWYW